MKNYTITVNGTVYDVTVEENAGGTQAAAPQAAVPQAAAKRAAAPRAAAQAVPQAAPQAAAPAAGGSQGAVSITAPMPGKILAVKANVGQAVKKGDVIIVLEAMKMENEIVAPSDGTVASINVAVGDTVEASATIATLN